MNKCLFIVFQFGFMLLTKAQNSGFGPLPQVQSTNIDSLLPLLVQTKNDTAKVDLFLLLGRLYQAQLERDSAFWCYQQAFRLSQKQNYQKQLFDTRYFLASLFRQNGNYPQALELSFTNLQIAEQYKDTLRLWLIVGDLCGLHHDVEDFKKQLTYARRLEQLALSGYFKRQVDIKDEHSPYLINMALAFDGLQQKDSALYYFRRYHEIALSSKNYKMLSIVNASLGDILLKYGQGNEARAYYTESIEYARASNIYHWIAYSYLGWARIFNLNNQLDSAFYYAKQALNGFQNLKQPTYELKAATFLDELYAKSNQMDSAHHYLALTVTLKDSLFNQEKVKQIQNLQFAATLREQQIEQERRETKRLYETRLKINSLIGGLAIVLSLVFILYRNNWQKKRANILLQQKNVEIDEQRSKAEEALAELKITQAQLIQSEKMASLGELTAGIAHEIQNPLNFVNNFSETNTELIEEVRVELKAGNQDEALSILDDIKANEQKINHHGKRADSIVKGMLQHSRTSSGQKELTDLNKLADEYLKLSYHGLRAKDTSFNAEIQTNFDDSVGKINIIPQDIGRVLLNLFNNAFYAVNERRKQVADGYEPIVTVTSKRLSDKLEIRVQDNGNGIPQNIIDKIFQPFFTTKPTGQGTGLGLSLSYDIIKVHGGEIRVNTKEGQGSEFIVELPSK